MKILIVGIDGLGLESLKALRMSRLEKRIEKGKLEIPQIDNVISRGWTEIYSGKTAYNTGAFYQVPVLKNQFILPSQKTGLDCVIDHIGKSELLWNKLNQLGLSCGLFGIPTTSPAYEINGFFVAATGAGKFGNKMSLDDFFPESFMKGLQLKNLDLGLRMGYGAFIPSDIYEFEERANKHLSEYFYLTNLAVGKKKTDILFIASRFVNELAYKFISLCKATPKTDHEKRLQEVVFSLAESFDILLDNFIENISPDHLFVVSDHGIGEFEYHVNLNQLLSEIYEIKYNARDNLKRKMRNQLVPYFFKTIPKKFPSYLLEKSRSFSIGFTDAIYLNDQRFTGKLYTEKERVETVDKIISKLRECCLRKKIDGLFEFKSVHHNGKGYTNAMDERKKIAVPDIRCHLKKGCTNTLRTEFEVIKKNSVSFGPEMFTRGFFGEYSGCKTEDTIAFYSGRYENDVHFDTLTAVYDSILAVAKKNGK